MSDPERPAGVATESTTDPAAGEALETRLDLRSTVSTGEVSEIMSLLEETAAVSKRRRVTGGVRIETRTELRQENAEVALDRHTVEVTRVPVNRLIEAAPEIRTDGDTTIIPVVEERFIVVKQFFLKKRCTSGIGRSGRRSGRLWSCGANRPSFAASAPTVRSPTLKNRSRRIRSLAIFSLRMAGLVTALERHRP